MSLGRQIERVERASPRFGGLTALTCLAVLVLQLALGLGEAVEPVTWRDQGWLATVWALWAMSVSVLVQQPLRLSRVLLLGLSLGWHCALLATVMERPPERCLIILAGYGLMQATATTLLGLPQWKSWAQRRISRIDRPRQFNVLSIVVLTTGVALVLFAARRYGDAGGDGFLSGTMLASSMLCIVYLLAFIFSTTPRRRLLGLPVIVMAAGAAGALLAMMEDAQVGPMQFRDYFWIYGSIVLHFGGLVYLICLCGFLDAMPTDDEESLV